MAQTWYCSMGDGLPAVVVLSSLEDGEATGQVSTPCAEHWAGLCIAVAVTMGYTAPEAPADTPTPEDPHEGTGPEPGPPDLQVAKVVRRSGGRRRSTAERGAMHAHLREAESGDQSG